MQRVDVPSPGLLCVTLYAEGKRHHLVAPFDGSGTPHLVAERPRGEPAGGLAQRLRKRLEGTRLGEASWRAAAAGRADALLLPVEGPQPGALCVVLDPRCANLVCLDADGRAIVVADTARFRRCGGLLGKPWMPPPEAPEPPFPDAQHRWQQAPSGDSRAPVSPLERAQREALRALRRRLRRSERKLAAIEADIARAQQAEALRAAGQLLLCHLGEIAAGAQEVTLPAADGGGGTERLLLDPALSAVANAERWFAQARRYERGLPIARERRALAQEERDHLAALVDSASRPGADLEDILASGPGSTSATAQGEKRHPRRAPRRPYRAFESEASFRILVGRSAADNDALTLHHARPFDLWLHVRESPGAHVLIPLQRGQACPDRVRLDAALLAAHFSPQAREARVDVSVCERRHVRKRRGSAPGTVEIERERVLPLRIDTQRLRWLLGRESSA